MAGLNPCCPWAKAPNPTSVCATLMTPRTRQRITRSLNVFSHFCCHNMVYWNLGPTRRGCDVWEPIRALIDPVRPLNDSHVGNRYSLDTLCSYTWSLGYSGNPQLKKSSPHKHASKLHEWSTSSDLRRYLFIITNNCHPYPIQCTYIPLHSEKNATLPAIFVWNVIITLQ